MNLSVYEAPRWSVEDLLCMIVEPDTPEDRDEAWNEIVERCSKTEKYRAALLAIRIETETILT